MAYIQLFGSLTYVLLSGFIVGVLNNTMNKKTFRLMILAKIVELGLVTMFLLKLFEWNLSVGGILISFVIAVLYMTISNFAALAISDCDESPAIGLKFFEFLTIGWLIGFVL